MCGYSCKLLSAVMLFSGCCLFGRVSQPSLQEKGGRIELSWGDLTLLADAASANFAVSVLRAEGETFLSGLAFVCQTKDQEVESEHQLAPSASRRTSFEEQGGEWRWNTAGRGKFLELRRTIAVGDFPGFKITYEYRIIRDFDARRLYLRFSMPDRRYAVTGYVENGVMQFRPVRKAEWLGIFRDPHFPYVTFGGATGHGVLIMAADRDSWERLPRMLLYSSGEKSYSSTEFMYHQGEAMRRGMTGRCSFFIVPVTGRKMAVEAAEIYAGMQDGIK